MKKQLTAVACFIVLYGLNVHSYVSGSYEVTLDGSCEVSAKQYKKMRIEKDARVHATGSFDFKQESHLVGVKAALSLTSGLINKNFDIDTSCSYVEGLEGDHSLVIITCTIEGVEISLPVVAYDCSGEALSNVAKKLEFTIEETYKKEGCCITVDAIGSGESTPSFWYSLFPFLEGAL